MRHVTRVICLLLTSLSLSGCTPSLSTRLYNATGELITLTKTQSKGVVRIPPGHAADFSPTFVLGERLIIRRSNHAWSYALGDVFVPQSLLEQRFGVLRAYARIDARGRIHALAPPQGSDTPREVPQPRGFPVAPRNET